MKKSTRKVAISQDSVITSFLADKKNNEVIDYAKTRGIELRINNIGMLVVKAPKNVSERIYKGLSLLANSVSISKEDIKSIIDGKDIVVEERETKERWDAMEFRHKNGKTIYIKPKNQHQQDAINQIVEKPVTFLGGSSGSGKTFIALAVALKYLEWKKVSKIVITRPSVTTEEFGFIPGGINEKMAPFLYPIMDMLNQLIGAEKRDKLIEDGTIEILSVAYSRGITIGSSYKPTVGIIDESENLTLKQIYLMLSRLGDHTNSKLIFCGDVYQSDLKAKDSSSLVIAEKILKDSKYVGFTNFTKEDVVRSAAVKDIVDRFEQYENSF
jgi:phosphate starvation-inducible PhoH-like protein